MFRRIRRSWQRFKNDRPGERFQEQFRRRRFSRSTLQKALFIGGGALLMGAGFFFLFVPGPGLLVMLIGAILIAQQSLLAARALDWLEVRLRALLARGLRLWKRDLPG
jgi:hypothetical protein